MKKNFMKFTKILVLTAMIVSDLMTPIKVFANDLLMKYLIENQLKVMLVLIIK